jgi:uncharacterized membrane protein
LGRLGDAKTLGGIGSILQVIPFVSIVGYILTLIAVKKISDELQDGSIFTDMLYAAIAGIVGAAVAASLLFFGFFLAAAPFAGVVSPVSIIGGIIVFLAVLWVAFIISAIFIRRAYEKIASRLNVGTFRTAGTLYLVGAALTIVLVGLIILFIAEIVQIVAFFSIQETMQPMPAPGMQASQIGMKYCANCGTQMDASVAFCPKCGAKQPV